MSKPTSAELERELDILDSIIRRHSAGIDRPSLSTAFGLQTGGTLPIRTLQRRVERLIDGGRARAHGEGPGRIYLPAIAPVVLVAVDTPRQTHGIEREVRQGENASIPVSAIGEELRALVRRPRGLRTYSTYDADWLFDYVPGSTWYLPESVRTHLHAIGRSPNPERPAGTFARDILERLLIDLSWASSRLEGNTYSRLDTQNLLEFGQRADGKDASEAQMILNHKAAIELIVSAHDDVGLNARTIRTVHAALSENLLADRLDEGRLRDRVVGITGTTYIPTAVPQLITECFDRIVRSAAAIPDPFEQSFFLMVHLPYLQPFIDVNKRTSRLAANIPLIKANLCPLTFIDVPEQDYVEGTLAVYEMRRTELVCDLFTWAYERSCEQYTIARVAVQQPNLIRLRFRRQIETAIAEMVRSGAAPSRERLRQWALMNEIPPDSGDEFAEVALDVLVNLNDASASRYGVRPSEFEQWRARFVGARTRA